MLRPAIRLIQMHLLWRFGGTVMERSPMTPQGEQALREELRRLKEVERPILIASIAEARAHGDLRENAEYNAARERQGFVEGRVRSIESSLARAEIIDISNIENTGRVIFGTTLELLRLSDDCELRYRIVGEDEADPDNQLISLHSPIARALVGCNVGDQVTVATPGGDVEYEIRAVHHL